MKTFTAAVLLRFVSFAALVLLLAENSLAQGGPKAQKAFAEADRRAPLAQECLVRANAVLEGWLAIRDPATGMMPRTTKQYVWAPSDNAADMYPFLFLTARFTAPQRVDELLALLRTEVSLTTRVDGLPDWFLIREKQFQHAKVDINRIIFAATEYAKDGLNPLIELDGPSPWASRMRQLVDGVIKHAPVDSDFGKLPSNSTEVNGELLQVLTRFYFLTNDIRYLLFAERIADAYCLEVLPMGGWLPAHRWDFDAHRPIDDVLSLNDHGNEIVGGLAELFAAVHYLGRESSSRYEKPLRRMFDTLLEKGRNEDGLWFSRLKASTAEPLSQAVPDTWGYALAGLLNFGLVTGEGRYVDAVRNALQNINKERYLDWGGADSFADSIEGALLLLQHLPEQSGFDWLEKILPRFFAKQKLPADGGTGIVEGWYGDGNYARTALMVALCYSGGAFALPWDPGLQLGGARDEVPNIPGLQFTQSSSGRLCLSLHSKNDWSGRLHFDHARHRDHFHLPHDLPRLNSFPEWYVIEPTDLFRVVFFDENNPDKSTSVLRLGAELIEGLPLELKAGEGVRLMLIPVGPPPHGREPEPVDPFEMLDDAGGDQALVDSSDLDGGESYVGETYRWTGRAPIEWTAQRNSAVAGADATGETNAVDCAFDATLWLRWGAKNDRRRARLTIGEHTQIVEHDGYNGFDWLAIDVPMEWWQGDQLPIRIEALESGAAFISAMRLRRFTLQPDSSAVTRKVEAEGFAGDWRTQDNLPGYSGTGFRVSNANNVAKSSLRTTIDLPAGRYQLWTRGFDNDAQDRAFAISIGERRFAATHRRQNPTSPGWNSSHGRTAGTGFNWQLAAHFHWPGGPADLQIHDAGTGFEVADCVLLTTDVNFDPGARNRIGRASESAPAPNRSIDDLIEKTATSAERAHKLIAGHQDSESRWLRERDRLRLRLAEALGLSPLPDRTPLQIRKMGTLQRDGYSIEKIVFDSRPGFPVTANVYVPQGGGPFPIVLCPVGHWGQSKAEPVVQARCIGLAKQGYLTLTYDPFGQGERNVPGNSHSEYFRSIVVAWNNMTFMVWDTMRALDYLLTRDDADGSSVACTGASGGGLNTLYAAAMDERISVAVPVVYLTRLREFLETKIGHCPCSHVNELARFMDMGDVVALIAPRPFLAITATQDPSFTPAGARAAMDQARGAYRILHANDKLELQEFDARHDYNQAMREAMYGWLAMHLKGASNSNPLPEPALQIEADATVLNCFESGHVPSTSQTVHSLSKTRATDRFHPSFPRQQNLGHWWRLADVSPAKLLAKQDCDAGLSRLRTRTGFQADTQPLLFQCADGTFVNGWRRPSPKSNVDNAVHEPEVGAAGSRPRIILISDNSTPRPTLAQAALSTQAEVIFLAMPKLFDHAHQHLAATNSLLLGDSLLAQRTRALTAALRTLRAENPNRPTLCCADGFQAKLALVHIQETLSIADANLILENNLDQDRFFDQPGPASDLYSWDLIARLTTGPFTSDSAIPYFLYNAAAVEKTMQAWVQQNN